MAERFADIASYQRGADLAAYARGGHVRILLKASEGTNYVNPLFGLWWQAAGTLGLARGAYHYAKPSRTSGTAEADHFHRTLRTYGGLGPRDWVCLDVEDPDATRKAAAHAAGFCRRMTELGYAHGVVYSGTWYLQPAGLLAAHLPAGWRRLHVARYDRTADDRVPLPPGWGREQVVARQYSSTATQPGIPGPSDANRVVREWLAPADSPEEPVTEQDKEDIANRVLAKLAEQIHGVTPEIRQARNAGAPVGATYNKVGDLQRAVGGPGGLAEQVGLVGIGVHTGRQEVAALGGKIDALMTMVGVEPVMSELTDFVESDLERKLDALLDHLGVEYPAATAPPTPSDDDPREELP